MGSSKDKSGVLQPTLALMILKAETKDWRQSVNIMERLFEAKAEDLQ